MYSQVYLQPLFAKYESTVVDMNKGRFSLRNLIPRIVGRSLMVGSTVFLASMLPFFADLSALMGALGFIPLCIIFPLLFETVISRIGRNKIEYDGDYSVRALCCRSSDYSVILNVVMAYS